jgi:hypothetical protein
MNRSARSQFCPNQRTEGSNRSIQQCSKETVNSMSLILCKLCCPLQVTYPMFAVFRATSSMTLDGDGSPRSTTSTAANIPLSADGGSEGGADDQQADEEGAERLSRGYADRKQKPVEQLDPETGEVIRTFPSASIAGKFYNIQGLQQRISMCCRGVISQTNGYIWRFSNKSDVPDPNAAPRKRAKKADRENDDDDDYATTPHRRAGRPPASAQATTTGTALRRTPLVADNNGRYSRGVSRSALAARRDKLRTKLASVGDWSDVNWTHCLCRSRWKTPKSLFHICLEAVWVSFVGSSPICRM